MALLLGVNLTWPNGTQGTLIQDDMRDDVGPDGVRRDAFLIAVRVARDGAGELHGRFRITYEAIHRLDGTDDAERSRDIGASFATFVATHGLNDGFAFSVVVADGGTIGFTPIA